MNYIIYNKRTCVTGKALFDSLNERQTGWRRNMSRRFKHHPDVLLRWGNSTLNPVHPPAIELNKVGAVSLTANKALMMQALSEDEHVRTPQVFFPEDFHDLPDLGRPKFFRNVADQVRYRISPGLSDKYCTLPIEKTHEYRVHIFNGKTLGIYEKIPLEGNASPIYKDDNCEFRRVDVSDAAQRRGVLGVRPMAKAAVNALGLLFGGVDVVMDNQGLIYVLEVNSAPGLNTLNIERWTDAIIDYIDSYDDESEDV